MIAHRFALPLNCVFHCGSMSNISAASAKERRYKTKLLPSGAINKSLSANGLLESRLRIGDEVTISENPESESWR